MSKLHFDYWMEIAYSEPVTECHYTIKCLPKDTDMQKISELKIQIFPSHQYQKGNDSFGNSMIYGNIYQEHDRFGFCISGIAQTGLASGDRENQEAYVGMYGHPHGLNRPGDAIRNYFFDIAFPANASAYEKGILLMAYLYRDYEYQKGITCIDTTAEDAWKLGKGVCQDYAHILIALCHLAKIPARYVTGMMIGEGYSHAWVEVLSDGIWYGLDPTNGCLVTDSYIKIGVGRDAKDCMINKGIMKGGGLQTQSVTVRVENL